MGSKGKIVISYPSDLSKELSIVSFANGNLTEDAKENIKFKCFECKSASRLDTRMKKRKRIMTAESKRLQYVGYNHGENGPRFSGMQNYYVGVLNKRTGKMKVFPSSMFQMKPYFEDLTETTNKDALKTSARDKNDLLVSAFGGKKKRQSMASKKRFAIDEDTLDESVKSTMADAKILETPESKTSPDGIPQQNKDANQPNEVYDIKNIISEEEYAALDDLAEELGNADEDKIEEWKQDGTYSQYVVNLISKVSSRQTVKRDKLKIMAYFDLIVQVLKLKYNDLRKKDPLPNIQDPLKQCLLNKFTVTSESGKGTGTHQRSMGPKMKDKAISNALVLALFLENFTVDLNQFQVDFKMSTNKLIVIANALGCHTSKKMVSKTSTTCAELKLPLFTPMKKFGGRK